MNNIGKINYFAFKSLIRKSFSNISIANQSNNATFFGFEEVTKDEKEKKVHNVFENVAQKYDMMNDIMSGGIHRVWKDIFVSRLNPTHNAKIIDVAGGTGDITFRILKYLSQNKNYTSKITSKNSSTLEISSEITVYDLSQNMLDVGRARADKLSYHGINWVCGNAEKLPFESNSFDCYAIAFGMRNVVNIERGLQEAYRILKPGGRFMCLEFSQVSNPVIRQLYDTYSFQMIPVFGQVIAADWNSYQYLVESIRKFHDQETYKKIIMKVGFKGVSYENLTFGIVAIHSGFKL